MLSPRRVTGSCGPCPRLSLLAARSGYLPPPHPPGMNYDDFLLFLRCFVCRAVHAVARAGGSASHHWLQELAWEKGDMDSEVPVCGGPINQAVFDLSRLSEVLLRMAGDEWFASRKNLEAIRAPGLDQCSKTACRRCDGMVEIEKRKRLDDGGMWKCNTGGCLGPECMGYLCKRVIEAARQS